MDYLYLGNNQQLADFCRNIEDADYCAIDTEFVREKTYYAELSLIQIGSDAHMACVDPQTIDDFSPLIALMQNPRITKVFHSPSQDLEILFQQFGQLPTPIFDTQLAAEVLGFRHQISYADLVQQVTGVQLDKKHTRANWNKRPLSQDELDYAMDDVRYLMPVYQQLKADLAARNRVAWIEKDLAAMSETANYQLVMGDQWKRLKGIHKLKGLQLQIASELAQWRETVAQQKNRPRRWIAKDDILIEIARLNPSSPQDFSALREIGENFIDQHGEAILRAVAQARSVEQSIWPQHDASKLLSVDEQALGDCLMALCRVISEKNDIALATLATRKDIDSLITSRKQSRLSQGWRFDMAGEQLLNFIHGQSVLGVKEHKIQISAG